MSDPLPPMAFVWSGEAMIPRYPKMADVHFTIGQTYVLVEYQARSKNSHDHFFAAVHEVFINLPEALAQQFKNEDALRKHALCMTGFRDERSIVCSSKAEAQRLAAFIAPRDDYAIISVSGSTVVELKAKSQSMRAMGREVFQASKQAALDYLAEMIGVEPATLSANAGQSA